MRNVAPIQASRSENLLVVGDQRRRGTRFGRKRGARSARCTPGHRPAEGEAPRACSSRLEERLADLDRRLDDLVTAWIVALGDWEDALRRGARAGSPCWERLESIEKTLEESLRRQRRLVAHLRHSITK